MSDQPEITLDDVKAEMTDLGRALLDQAVGSALRTRQLRAELARVSNALAVPEAGDPDA